MRKYISLLLTVALIFTMFTLPAEAASTVFHQDSVGNVKLANMHTVTTATGVRGRALDDVSTRAERVLEADATQANKLNHKGYQFITGWTNTTDIIAFEVSFYPVSGVNRIYLATDGSMNLSGHIHKNNVSFIDGWNKLVFVYDLASTGTKIHTDADPQYCGNWTAYLNGVCLNEWGTNRVKITDEKFIQNPRQLRLTFDETGSGEKLEFYHDDVKLYSVDSDFDFTQTAPVLTDALNGEYTVSDNSIVIENVAKVSDIQATSGATVRVFSDGQYNSVLSADDALAKGNKVVVEKDGLYNYYTVAAAGEKILFEAYNTADMGNVVRGTISDENGIAGRDASDPSIRAVFNVWENDSGKYNGYYQHTVGTQSNGVWEYADYDGYLVIEGSVIADEGTRMNVCSDGNASMGGVFSLNAGQWNKFYVIYKFADKTVMTVTNGVQSAWTATNFGKLKSGTTSTICTSTRLRFQNTEAYGGAYIDDYKIYLSKNMPEISTPAKLDESKYNISEYSVALNNGEKVSDIVCDGATVKAFTDTTYTSQLASGEQLVDGNVIVLVSEGGDYTYYNVVSKLKRVPVTLVEQRNDASNLTGITVFRATKSVEYGVGNRRADEASGLFTGQTTPTTDSDFFSATTTTSAMLEKNIVVSVMVYPNDTIDSVFFATGGHSPLSASVSVMLLAPNQWNRLTLVHNPATGVSDLYVNDVYKSSTTQAIKSNAIRFLYRYGTETIGESYMHYDDYYVYSGEVAIPAITSEKYVIENVMINGYGKSNAAQVKTGLIPALEGYTVTLIDGEGNEMDDADMVDSSCEVMVYDGTVPVSRYGFGIADYEISDDASISSGGYVTTDKKFGSGEVTVKRDFINYGEDMDIISVAAQYDSDGNMLSAGINPQTISGNAAAQVTLDAVESEGSYIKFMILDKSALKPLASAVSFDSYATDKIELAARLYEGYTTKSMVFNYDDCRWEDQHLIQLLDQYGMKGTFNLVSGNIIRNLKSLCLEQTGANDDASVLAFAKELYKDHEISNHTVSHRPSHLDPGEIGYDSKGNQLVGVSTEEEIADIVGCPAYIKENFGVDAIGMAWPNGYGTSRSDYESDLLPAMIDAGIKYARAPESNNFNLPEDWYRWSSTCHHNSAPLFAEKFVALENSGDLKCFFNWGHTYEFEQNEGNDSKDWTMIENVMKTLQPDNIWFATNGDIYRYVEATKLVEVTDTTVTNNSDMTVYYNINGTNVELAPGEVYSVVD